MIKRHVHSVRMRRGQVIVIENMRIVIYMHASILKEMNMIDILIPFLIGSVFGAMVGFMLAALVRANDETMCNQ